MSLDVYLKLDAVDHTNMYSDNITHNLAQMASEAGLYEVLWCPNENNLTKASQLVEPLFAGLKNLISEPERFEKFNPENGWGDYNGLVEFVVHYLIACNRYPKAEVTVWK